MKSTITRRNILLWSGAGLTSTMTPNFGRADPDVQPPAQTRRVKKKQKRKKQLTSDDWTEINELSRRKTQCLGDATFERAGFRKLLKDIEKKKREVATERNRQIDRQKNFKIDKEADRKQRVELRRGKDKTGKRHTLKQKDALVRKINSNASDLKRQQDAIKRTKARVKELGRELRELQKEERRRKNAVISLEAECRSIDQKIEKIKTN